MADVVDLNARRAMASSDGTKWSPVEALRYFLKEIDEGKIRAPDGMVMIGIVRDTEGIEENFYLLSSGLSMLQQMGVLSMGQKLTGG